RRAGREQRRRARLVAHTGRARRDRRGDGALARMMSRGLERLSAASRDCRSARRKPMSERERGYAEVNGARLYYEVAGSGPALVLIHAGIADCRMWDEQFAALAARYRVVRYDQRGYGQSS